MNEEEIQNDDGFVHLSLDEEDVFTILSIIENELNSNENFTDYFYIKDIHTRLTDALNACMPESENKVAAAKPIAGNQWDTFDIVSRYGEDDIALWTVDITREDFNKIAQNAVRVHGTPEDVLAKLPVTDNEKGNLLHFVFASEQNYTTNLTLCTCSADQAFIDKYIACGCSVRGSVQDVLYDYLTRDEPTVSPSLTVFEAMAVNDAVISVLGTDHEKQRILEAANAKLEKAIGHVPVSDYENDEDLDDDFER